MNKTIRSFGSAALILIIMVTLIFTACMYRSNQLNTGDHVVSEGTVTDKHMFNHVIGAASPMFVKRYCLTADIAGNTYSLTVPCDTYDSIKVGDSLMFDLTHKNDEVIGVSVATAEDLTELSTE